MIPAMKIAGSKLVENAKDICFNKFNITCKEKVPVKKPEPCNDCVTGLNKLFSYVKNDALVKSMANFKNDVCPKLKNSEFCVQKVEEWWPIIVEIPFSDQAPSIACPLMDPKCEKFR